MGFCPLPSHDGKRRSPSFSANVGRGVFHCFGCGAKGNVLDFPALMEKLDPKDGRELKKAAIKLQAAFCPDGASAAKPDKTKPGVESAEQLTLAVNDPLDFELQGLDPSHPYLASRGFVRETANLFGLGYCSRRYLAGRIAIPLHDTSGALIGYAGRIVDDAKIDEDNPKYRLPTKREREDKAMDFQKTKFVYNAHAISAPVQDLAVVEGFPSVWWLVQNGFRRAVATMGADCSDEQADIIVSKISPDGHVWIMADGDKAGERLAQVILTKTSPRRFVRWAQLGERKQPTDLSAHELKSCLQW